MDEPSAQCLRDFIARVDDEMISEDETDPGLSGPGLKMFRRVKKGWVNTDVTRILHMLLDVHLHRLNIYGELGAGNKFRQRVNHPPARTVMTNVVIGLPENFYEPQWLSSISAEERQDLRCQSPVDLDPYLAMLHGYVVHNAGG